MEQYLVFAEGQAMRRIPMHMADWIEKLDAFRNLNDRDILTHAGKICHEMAKELAEQEYEKFHALRIAENDAALSDFDRTVKQLEAGRKGHDKKPAAPRRRKGTGCKTGDGK